MHTLTKSKTHCGQINNASISPDFYMVGFTVVFLDYYPGIPFSKLGGIFLRIIP
ncbi:hypothetical protein CLV45_4308 [Hymenobacter chitinivorans DSM 11115]|uniref:Uncharacterized protein n=1 Tax=Hymenobacter chitinivorans DSM 11115 TaxID=1121954 RepID=A0A2M9ASC8_9BACT|nr:hypothetical protein CLV45_4308 [Hymenobacter chitinivorans DSM 11115]